MSAEPVALDVRALRSADGRALSLRVVNPLPLEVEADIVLQGFAARTVEEATLLTSASRDDANDDPDEPMRVAPRPMPRVALVPGDPPRLAPIRYPPYSFVVVRLSA